MSSPLYAFTYYLIYQYIYFSVKSAINAISSTAAIVRGGHNQMLVLPGNTRKACSYHIKIQW